MELAKIKESQGDITDAANILQELQVQICTCHSNRLSPSLSPIQKLYPTSRHALFNAVLNNRSGQAKMQQ